MYISLTMSPSTQTTLEEHCLNCGEELHGRYCSHCGQKAGLRKDSFGHMVVHFIGDYFHYDNKFWTTFKALITKPGQVTLDYIEDRRARYLNPIQLYIFVVTVMVLLTIGQADTGQDNVVQTPQPGTAQPAASSPADSLQQKQAEPAGTELNIGLHSGPTGQGVSIGPWTPTQPTLSAYDSVQQALPEAERDGMLKRMVRRKYLKMQGMGTDVFMSRFWTSFYHGIPKVLFLLLPFFALLLKLFFGRKNLYYVDHIVFSLHFHSMVFLLIILNTLLGFVIHSDTVDDLSNYLILGGFAVYLLLSLLRVYRWVWWWTVIKQLLLMFVYVLTFGASMILLLFVAFLVA